MPPLTSTLLLAVVMAPPNDTTPRFAPPQGAVDLGSRAGVDAAAREWLHPATRPMPLSVQLPFRERRAGVSVGTDRAIGTAAVRAPSNAAAAEQAEFLNALPPRTKNTAGFRNSPAPTRSSAITTVMASLSVVLGLFFLIVWFSRRSGHSHHSRMPLEVLEVLGRTPLSPRMQMHVVRFGSKLVLLAVSAEGAVSLAEITEPLEVDRLAGACKAGQTQSMSDSFRQVLGQLGEEPATGGFLGVEVGQSVNSITGANSQNGPRGIGAAS